MNKVVTINLGGNAYQLEDGGYEALRAYLDTAAARLQANPDRDEILSDIERSIAEKFRGLLTAQKNVVETGEVAAVLEAMGPVEPNAGEPANTSAATGDAGGQGSGQAAPTGQTPRRLYRIKDGAMIEGVCTGLSAYFNVDVTLVRLAFALAAFAGGAGVGVYIVMAIIVPTAVSPEEKAAAGGGGFPATAAEFIRRAKEGYYEAMRNFPDRKARREWKRQFRREIRASVRGWCGTWPGWAPPQAPVHPGMGYALPIISLLVGAATILWLCAFVSLLATGAVLGLVLPADVPVWLAAILLMVLYGMIVAPLKAARRWCYWGSAHGPWGWSFVHLLDALVRVAVLITLIVMAIHFLPQLRDAVQGVPAAAHQATVDVESWGKGK